MVAFSELKEKAGHYLQGVDLAPLDQAYEFIVARHAGKKHRSGINYVQHLVETADTLASMRLDRDTVVAGLLHGSLKEGVAEQVELVTLFGEGVAGIVAGTTKITNVRYTSRLANQAENVRKLFLAMSRDIRVLLVKLADRYQDMVGLYQVTQVEYQQSMARDTLELYAPLASRLGIDWLKRELEDLAFRYLYPAEYSEIVAHLTGVMAQRETYIEQVIKILHDKLAKNQITPLQVLGRPKHLYSIHKKLVAQNITLDRVYDKVAFRIILNSSQECYETLGVVHGEWHPIPGRIKDFISTPKSNNYQSLHTTVLGPSEHFIEIQIRTEEMDRIAQEGIAAHWAYKEGQQAKGRDQRLFRDLKRMVASLQDVQDHGEFLETVRSELFEPEVYVLTPTGEVRELVCGSTPIDFAYAIHTAVGDHCSSAKVNGRMVPLRYVLQNGDLVEIITAKSQQPRQAWLSLAKTARAKSRIRQYLHREAREKKLGLGREICERALYQAGTSLKKMVKSGHVRWLLNKTGSNTLDELMVKVGSGQITVRQLERVLSPTEMVERGDLPLVADEHRGMQPVGAMEQLEGSGLNRVAESEAEAIDIDGLDDMLVRVSQCCRPVPGDRIGGFITTGQGVAIHKHDCLHFLKSDPERRLALTWSGSLQTTHRAELMVHAENRRNLLADITTMVNSVDGEIINLNARTRSNNLAELQMMIEVTDLAHLGRIQQRLVAINEVLEVRRC